MLHRAAGKVPVSETRARMWDRWALVLNIARDWTAVVGQAAVLVAEITVLLWMCVCVYVFLGVSSQLLAGHWGRGQSLFL